MICTSLKAILESLTNSQQMYFIRKKLIMQVLFYVFFTKMNFDIFFSGETGYNNDRAAAALGEWRLAAKKSMEVPK